MRRGIAIGFLGLLCAGPAAAEGDELQAFLDRVAAQVLNGPVREYEIAGFRAELARFEPADRLRAIIFLRRVGVMEGDPVPLELLLRPRRENGNGEPAPEHEQPADVPDPAAAGTDPETHPAQEDSE